MTHRVDTRSYGSQSGLTYSIYLPQMGNVKKIIGWTADVHRETEIKLQ
jgi:hypothetical protein